MVSVPPEVSPAGERIEREGLGGQHPVPRNAASTVSSCVATWRRTSSS